MSSERIMPEIDLGRLPQYARNVARSLTGGGGLSSTAARMEEVHCGVWRRALKRTLRRIDETAELCAELIGGEYRLPDEAEWLLDNRYIVIREGKRALMALRGGGYLRARRSGGEPVVLEAADALLRSGRCYLDEERMDCFLTNFQQILPLTERELSLLAPMLVVVLVRRFAQLSRSVARMLRERRDEDTRSPFGAERVHERLRAAGEPVTEPIAARLAEAQSRHAELTQGMANVITSLRTLGTIDIARLHERQSVLEQTLCRDPSGVYARMTEESRAMYRTRLAAMADRRSVGEAALAREIVEEAERAGGRHIGYWLLPKGKRGGRAYLLGLCIVSLLLTGGLAALTGRVWSFFLLLLPAVDAAKRLVDHFVLKFVRPRRLPRMELEEGLPEEGTTLCAIATLMGEDTYKLADALERIHLSNRSCGGRLYYALLADLKEAGEETLETDAGQIARTRQTVAALNEKYGARFFLFVRARRYNARMGKFIPWERKRGAVLELLRLLRGQESTLHVAEGEQAECLHAARYLLLLDSDTEPGIETVRELVSAALHPMNRPVVSEKGVVTAGYGVLQPRVVTDLAAANRSWFSKVYAGQGGFEPYATLCSDLYYDISGEGSYTGKGLIEIDAFLRCLDHRLPNDRILSHDLLEGSYLRTGFAGDVEFSDGFPSVPGAYFKRMHRWTRGDWQLLPWLCRRVRNEAGEKVENPLDGLSKWKIFDNLRRSLTPCAQFVLLLLGALGRNPALCAAALITALLLLTDCFSLVADKLLRPGDTFRRVYRSNVAFGLGALQRHILFSLLLLPVSAVTNFSAIVTALYRQFISRRNMLAWLTAAEAERRSGRPGLSEIVPPLAAGVLCLLLSPYVLGRLLGLLWLLGPLAGYWMGRPCPRAKGPTAEERTQLLQSAREIWGYFAHYMTAERHYLPPDNEQVEPTETLAERTSPTNIGLALLSALAAVDLRLCPPEKAVGLIDGLLTTVEGLEKWEGHLYNWYDTRRAEPLRPRSVSTVDSGNLAGCLIALSAGLRELGEHTLAARADRLCEAMRFAPLYDKKRALFHISYDVDSGRLTEGCYDLMESEARQTSFIAVARGEVPRKHWQRLGRPLACVDGYCGMASWSGSMFEYLMPNLLMPSFEHSLLDESLRLCLRAQKKWGVPWGVSESSFFAFDPAMNYSYKAHGVQALALRRGMQDERVVSPYSTFLAAPYDTKAAVANLRRLRRMDMEGRFGLYEALDLTARRTGGKPKAVKCFMAHHLGMSLLSIANTLCDGVMRRRFMSEPRMAAYAKLLQEKGPVGSVVTRAMPSEVQEKGSARASGHFRLALPGYDLEQPTCALLSNSSYTLLIADTGKNRSRFDGMAVTRFAPGLWEEDGLLFFLRVGERLTALQPAPAYEAGIGYHMEIDGACARQYAKTGSFESCIESSVPASESGEKRVLTLCNPTERPLEAELVCYFVPVLARERDYEAHPAFSRLSMQSAAQGNALVFSRRAGGSAEPVSLCFACTREMRYDTSREQALGRGGLRALPQALRREAGGTVGPVLDPCLLARVKLTVAPGETERVGFALALAKDALGSAAAAARILRRQDVVLSRLDSRARALEMPNLEITRALRELSTLVFETEDSPHWRRAVETGCQGREGLWRFGISGDLPVLAACLDEEERLDDAVRLIQRQELLRACGFACDLVFLLGDRGSYHRPLNTGLRNFLRAQGLEGQIGVKGGVHLVDATGEEREAVLAMSGAIVPLGEREEWARVPKNQSPKLLPAANGRGDEVPEVKYEADGSVVIQTKGGLNRLAWTNVLTNGSVGYLAELAGTGNMWYKNAREKRINVWKNDPLGDVGTELVMLERQGRRVSLFAARDEIPCTVTFGFGFARWEKRFDGLHTVMTAYVHPVKDARVLLLELEGVRDDDKLIYFTDLLCGAEKEEAATLQTRVRNGNLEVFHAKDRDKENCLTIMTSEKLRHFTTRFFDLFEGNLAGNTGVNRHPCLYAAYSARQVFILVSGKDGEQALSELCSEAGARAGLADTVRYWKRLVGGFRLRSPDEALNRYLNGWALYQVLTSRLLGRTSLYQSGGAYGFRDQLQDVCALIAAAPELTEEFIRVACRHQYLEGDVQHWWHPNPQGDWGVRTRYSDDLLWLPYAVCTYCRQTGKLSLLYEQVDYLRSETLREREHDRYERPEAAAAPESVYQHCLRAIDCVLSRGRGAHGLLHIGGGDWNDGMGRVGQKGRGESVWLTWFAALVLREMAELAGKMGESERAAMLRENAGQLGAAADAAWDGAWYLRAFYDDGRPMGSAESAECTIDSIAQSFAAFSGCGDPERVQTALRSAYARLYNPQTRTVSLFTPPFDGVEDPGYIRAYLPGVRENGGQYTHAAVWLAGACLRAGLIEEGWTLLRALLPSARDGERYLTEPYVLAGDVYTTPGHEGRGGWSWYTGAAAWYYRTVLEELLGIRFENGEAHFAPRLPQSWDGFEASLFAQGKVYSFSAHREADGGIRSACQASAADGSGIEQTVNSSV